MPKANRSSASVKVTYLDQQAVQERIRRAVDDLASHRPEIKRVLLFGSLAAGRAVPGSDADLLVVLEYSDRSFLERIPLYTPAGCRIGLDVFPYTEAEIESMRVSGNWLIRRALAEGVEIYTRAADGRA